MISILLATYNGEKYIREQIDSILGQTVDNFTLYINDDKSTDSTFDIAGEYTKQYPGKIIATQNEANSGHAKLNFMDMIISRKDDYLMLCDQDDVWLPDKIEKSLSAIKKLESEHGVQTPLLVHTDLEIVNENLETMSSSYFELEDINTNQKTLNKIVARNIAPGCSIMYNRALSDLITTKSSDIIMHDWWLVLIAAALGETDTIFEKTILYRQHSTNEIGIVKVKTIGHIVSKLINFKKAKKVLTDTYNQASVFLDNFEKLLSKDQKDFLQKFCDIPNHTKIVRWVMVCRLGVLKKGVLRKISSFIFI